MIYAIVADTRRLRIFEAVEARAPLELVVFANPAGGKPERHGYVQRQVQCCRDFESDRHAAARHSQDDRVSRS